MLKESRKATNKNADPYDKKLKTTKRDQLRLENSLARIKAKLKAINSKVNNTKGKVSDMKDRIMKITQSEQQTEKWWGGGAIYGVIR